MPVTPRFNTFRCLSLLGFSLLGGAVAAESVPSNEPLKPVLISTRHVLDWVPLMELTPNQRQALPPGSCGAYIAPLRQDAEAELDPASAPLRALSNQSRLDNSDPAGAKVLLLGDVVVQQGYRQLRADRAELDEARGELLIEGQMELREPGLLLLGERAQINRREELLLIEDSQFVLHEVQARGSAASLKRTSAQKIELRNARYTRCEPENEAWVLQGSKVTLDFDRRQGVARNVTLKVKHVPVFYFPYLRFPLGDERLSGFLAPTVNIGRSGYRVSLPYYFNLAPNYDLTWTAHAIEQHGLLNEWNGRHLSRHFSTDVNLGFLSNDRGVPDQSAQRLIDRGELTEAQAVPFKGEDRWLFNLNQEGGRNQPWHSRVDYTEVSDINLFKDFSELGIVDSDTKFANQLLTVGYQLSHWRADATVRKYERLLASAAEPYQSLPELKLNGAYEFGRWRLKLEHEWTRFANPDSSDAKPIITGDRLRVDYGVNRDYSTPGAFIKPSVEFSHLQYALNDRQFDVSAEANPAISGASLSLDTGLVFEREVSGFSQIFEPRLFYWYSPYQNHDQLFDLTMDDRDINFDTSATSFSYDQIYTASRFSGNDRVADANQIGYGFTTRFLGNESGLEWFSAGIGQILYFTDRRVTLNNTTDTEKRSDIAVRLRSNPTPQWQLSSDLLLDDNARSRERDSALNKASFGARYRSRYNNLLNFNYQYEEKASSAEDNRSMTLSFISPLASHRWHLFGQGAYDLNRKRELEVLSAVEYQSCCYRLRLGYRHYLDKSLQNTAANVDVPYDWSTFLEIQFHGLGDTGKQLDTLFDEKISGYDAWRQTHSRNK